MSSTLTRFATTAWRRLLQLDRPVPDRSQAEFEAEVSRNYSWNFSVNLTEGVFFWIGLSFISGTTIAPLFVSKLSDSPLLIGLVAVISQAGWYLPQLLTARYTQRLPRKKPMVVNVGFIVERVPVWLWPLAAILAIASPKLALVVFLAGYALHTLGAGAIGPAWQDMVANCFPVNRRGRFWGSTTFIGTGVGTAAAVFASYLLKTYPFPMNFMYSFTLAAAGITISWFFIALTREPVRSPEPVLAQAAPGRGENLLEIVRTDRNFRHFLLARLLLALGTMGAGFVAVSAVFRWQVPDATVGLYTIALLVGQTGGNLSAGWLSDRFGHKLSLEMSAMASFAAFLLVLLSPSPDWYYVVFAIWGFAAGCAVVSGVLSTLEYTGPTQRPTYIGITNSWVGLGYLAGPLLGAALAGFGYQWVFAASAVVSLVAWMTLHWYVKDPRWLANS